MKSATLIIDKSKNVLEAPTESPPPPISVGIVDRLVLKLATGYTIPVMLGWIDPSPRPLSKGGIVAMWMAQLEVAAPSTLVG